jgi:hypothetical protein
MDGKKSIRLDFTKGDVIEECIDMQIAFTPACSIYLLIQKGLVEVGKDINEMKFAFSKTPENDINTRKLLETHIQVAELAFKNGIAFTKELAEVIKELDSEPKKVIIHKPTWDANSKP